MVTPFVSMRTFCSPSVVVAARAASAKSGVGVSSVVSTGVAGSSVGVDSVEGSVGVVGVSVTVLSGVVCS